MTIQTRAQAGCWASGKATAGGNTTITDTTANWGENLLAGGLLRLRGGTSDEEVRSIASNTATEITVSAAWSSNPSAGDVYEVFLTPTIAVDLADINTTLGSPAQAGEVAAAAISIDLANIAKRLIRAHTTAGTAEEVAGGTAFDAGATLLVLGKDTYVRVGTTKATAEAGPYMPAGVPFKLKLATGATTFWLDAATGGTYSVMQVS